MEENSYKENLIDAALAAGNGDADRNDLNKGAAGEYGKIPEAEGEENTHRFEGFLYIPVLRLILLSVLTFGIYCFYWQYRNWVYVKEREEFSIRPFWRAWFWPFFVYALLKEIRKDSYYHQADQPSFSPLLIAIAAILLEIITQSISKLPYQSETIMAEMVALWIIGLIIGPHLAFIPVQLYVNRCEQKLHSGNTIKSAWSKGHLFCYVWTILAVIIGVLSGLA